MLHTSLKMKDRKRYHLVMPNRLFNDVRRMADARGTTVVATILACIRIGLLAFKAADSGQPIIIRDGLEEHKLLLL